MAFLLGGSFVSSVVSREVYDPVYDTEVDSGFLYDVLPSYYRDLMLDKDVFSETWNGLIQALAGSLLTLWQSDYAKSLQDVPVLSQHKWVYIDLYRTEAFTQDPLLTQTGLQGVFAHALAGNLLCRPENRTRWDRATSPLRSAGIADTVDQGTSLAWSVEVTTSSIESRGAVLFGYYGSDGASLANALAMGVFGKESGENTPVAALLHASPSGALTAAVDSFEMSVDTSYRMSATYTARTGNVVLVLTELLYERLTSTTGASAESLLGGWTPQFSDASVDFGASGVVAGDTLRVFGEEFKVTSVSGSNLVVTPASLPEGVTGATYSVVGEEPVSSISMNLPADASDPTFSVGHFGASSLDTRKVSALVFSSPTLSRGKKASVVTDNWSYLDPTSSDVLLSVPRLQDTVVSPTELLHEGTDYHVDVLDGGSAPASASTIRFQEPPLKSLWAEYVAYDDEYIYDNFGSSVGLTGVSTDQYKARVRGLYYSYFRGPTVSAIRTGVHILVGLPIADAPGTVTAVNPAFSGVFGQITVDESSYLYPAVTGTSLRVGDPVALFQPLSDGVEVVDYLTSPEWFVSLSKHELEKYHSFQVLLDLDAFSLETLSLAATFVEQIKPTWKSPTFTVFKNLRDDVEVTDTLTFGVNLEFVDAMCDVALVAYDDAYFEGSEPNWRYDQGVTAWGQTSASMRATSTLLSGAASLTPGVGTQIDEIPSQRGATAWTTDIGTGSVTDKYVAFGRYSDSSTGETTLGSPLVLDNTPNVFEFVSRADRIEITGEGVFEVNTVDRNVFSSGTSGEFDTSNSFTDPLATFLSDGLQVGDILAPSTGKNAGSEFVVTSVVGETQLLLATAALPSLVSSGAAAGFTAPTVWEEAAATWVTDGVLPGDIVLITGGGPNSGLSFQVGTVIDENTLAVLGTGTTSSGESYTIVRKDVYGVERLNQVTLNTPMASTASGVLWNAIGQLSTWTKISSVVSDSLMGSPFVFPGSVGNYVAALLDNRYLNAYYDSFEELCPDEAFSLTLTYTNGAAPGVTTVPSSDPLVATTFTFTIIGDAYSVTLAEAVP